MHSFAGSGAVYLKQPAYTALLPAFRQAADYQVTCCSRLSTGTVRLGFTDFRVRLYDDAGPAAVFAEQMPLAVEKRAEFENGCDRGFQ